MTYLNIMTGRRSTRAREALRSAIARPGNAPRADIGVTEPATDGAAQRKRWDAPSYFFR